jgi:microcin C transport system ATP-binding protein
MQENLLSIEHLAVAFAQGKRQVTPVSDVTLSINPGETLALVGESGSGKSLTAHAILRLLPYPAASHPQGKILFQGMDLLQMPLGQMRLIRGNKIGMIFQEPMTALNPLHTVQKQLREVIRLHRHIDKAQMHEEILSLLRKVKIPDPETKMRAYPHQLSGGQRQRVMIAMALANDPTLLIADEPTTALDVTVQREILDLLQELQRTSGMAMLLITHDLGVVRHVADRVAVMYRGQIVETSPTAALFSNPQHSYTRELLNCASNMIPAPVDANAEVVLQTQHLNVRFGTDTPLFGKSKHFFSAVSDASITLRKGHTLGVVGESGSGKSTLAMAILRLLDSEGVILCHGHRFDQLREDQLRPLRRNIQVVFQDPFASLSPRMTVSEIIAEGLHVHARLEPHAIDSKVVQALQEVGLDPESRHRYPHEFSGGQRQRIAIARALILDPAIIILDEPTSALDRSVQIQVVALLKKLQTDRGLTYLFISHDLKVIKALSHEVVVMRNGEIVEHGPAATLLENPAQQYTRDLLSASFA